MFVQRKLESAWVTLGSSGFFAQVRAQNDRGNLSIFI
jgi:hypothetical protein